MDPVDPDSDPDPQHWYALIRGCAFRREPCGEPVCERGAAHEHRQDGHAGPVRAAHVGGDGAVRPTPRLHG